MRFDKAKLFVVTFLTVAAFGAAASVNVLGASTSAIAQDDQANEFESQFYTLAGLCHILGPNLSAVEVALNDGATFLAFGDPDPNAYDQIGRKVWTGREVLSLPLDQRIALANQWYVEAGGSKDECPNDAHFGTEFTDEQDSNEATIKSLAERVADLESQIATLSGAYGSGGIPPVNLSADLTAYGIDDAYAFDMKCGIALPSNPYREANRGFYLFHCERISPFGFSDHEPKILVFDELLP